MKPKKLIYLDHAASTPLDTRVMAGMRPYLEEKYYNPSSLYGSARKVRAEIEDARHRVAQALGAKKTEIIFTAGGTESINLALFGVVRSLSYSNDNRIKIVVSAIEHEAVLTSVKALEAEGHEISIVPVESDGIVLLDAIEAAIDDQTALVSIMYANNEIGTIQPIIKIAQIVAKIRRDRQKRDIELPIYLHTDACQAAGFLDLHVSRLGVDLLSLNGSKIYGPKQTGILYVRTGVPIMPLIYGGGQERGRRSGTENVAGIIGLALALELAQSERIIESRRLAELRDRTITELHQVLPDIKLNGHPLKRLPNNLNISVPGISGETAVLYLDQAGIMVSTGSACTTGRTDPSHVLLAIGCSETEASGSLRLTLGRTTSTEDIKYTLKTMPEIITRLRSMDVAENQPGDFKIQVN